MTRNDGPYDISRRPVHLGLGARCDVEPDFSGAPEWYGSYVVRHEADGVEGRLVTQHTFDSWTSWEMHPKGSEVVLVIRGKMTLIQDVEGEHRRVELGPGQYAINAPGVWHTADTSEPTTALFITAGIGTQHKPR